MDTTTIIIIVFAVAVIAADYYFKIRKNKVKEEKPEKTIYEYKRRQFFMSRAEHDFYDRLVNLFGDKYHIFPQVHLSTILDEKVNGQNWKAALSVINRKSVDYVICDKTYINPLVAIELDDWSHERDDRKERDGLVEEIFAKANMPLVRFNNVRQMQDSEIANKIGELLNRIS